MLEVAELGGGDAGGPSFDIGKREDDIISFAFWLQTSLINCIIKPLRERKVYIF